MKIASRSRLQPGEPAFRRIPRLAATALLVAALCAAGCGRDDGYEANTRPQGGGYPPQAGYQAQGGGGYPPQARYQDQAWGYPSQTGYQPQGRYQTQGGYAPQAGYQPQGGGYQRQTADGAPPAGAFPDRRDRAAPPPRDESAEGGRGVGMDALMAWERQDMGVQPTAALHDGPMHGPTPNRIPGGQVITTKGLVPLLQQGVPAYVFDVLGSAQGLPNAIPAAAASQPGSFDDDIQQQFGQMLQQATRGNAEAALVFYCAGPQCWMSYNAALRAIRLGYRNVLWYRGGLEAWQRAGLQLAGTPG